MSLSKIALRNWRERMMDLGRRLRPQERADLLALFNADELATISERERQFQADYKQRVAVEKPVAPTRSHFSFAYATDINRWESEHRSQLNYIIKWTQKVEAERNRISKLDWADQQAKRGPLDHAEAKLAFHTDCATWFISDIEKFYNRMTPDDKRYYEDPRFPATSFDDVVLAKEHICMVYWPDEPDPFRRAVISVIDEVLAQ